MNQRKNMRWCHCVLILVVMSVQCTPIMTDVKIVEEEAVETLRHEFLDYCISKAIEPYKEVTNRLIRIMNENAYRKKEGIVEALNKLLNKDTCGG